jgi:hypothetical protein
MGMVKRLLDRQTSLLEYLSSATAMFGHQTNSPAAPALQAFDPGVLRLQARFICNKRIEKIIAVFPRTLQIVSADRGLILREFVEASRSTKKSSLANAREFHGFLSMRWQCSRPRPAYLPDVAACELAMAEARDVGEDHERPTKDGKSARSRQGIRRRRNVIPLRCAYDVRAMFDAGSGDVVPPKRAISLIVSVPAGFREVRIVETTPPIVEVLSLLGDWADPSTLDAFGDREKLLVELAASELIEVSELSE